MANIWHILKVVFLYFKVSLKCDEIDQEASTTSRQTAEHQSWPHCISFQNQNMTRRVRDVSVNTDISE